MFLEFRPEYGFSLTTSTEIRNIFSEQYDDADQFFMDAARGVACAVYMEDVDQDIQSTIKYLADSQALAELIEEVGDAPALASVIDDAKRFITMANLNQVH